VSGFCSSLKYFAILGGKVWLVVGVLIFFIFIFFLCEDVRLGNLNDVFFVFLSVGCVNSTKFPNSG